MTGIVMESNRGRGGGHIGHRSVGKGKDIRRGKDGPRGNDATSTFLSGDFPTVSFGIPGAGGHCVLPSRDRGFATNEQQPPGMSWSQQQSNLGPRGFTDTNGDEGKKRNAEDSPPGKMLKFPRPNPPTNFTEEQRQWGSIQEAQVKILGLPAYFKISNLWELFEPYGNIVHIKIWKGNNNYEGAMMKFQ